MDQRGSTTVWRVFIACELPLSLREQLSIRTRRLREIVPQAQASWSRPENIHLTLKFLGDTPASRGPSVAEAVSRAVKDIAPFSVVVEGEGVFPPSGAPRVLWVGVTDSQRKLRTLHQRLEAECARVNFKEEKRPFNPHLTIARLRRPAHADVLATAHKSIPFEPIEFYVSEVLVMRSELSSAGSRYTTISRHSLAGL